MLCLFAILGVTLAGPPAPTITDATDAAYLLDTRRFQEAADWYRARMEREPERSAWVAGYLRALTGLPGQRHPRILEVVQAWTEAHPEATDGGVLVARARSLQAMGPSARASDLYLDDDPGWCEAALADLSALPTDPGARFRVLSERAALPPACGVDREATRATLNELARTGAVGPVQALLATLGSPTPTKPPPALVEAVLAAEPAELVALGAVLGDGKGHPEVRAAVEEHARRQLDGERPARVFAAARCLHSLGHDDEAAAGYERVLALDPGNGVAGPLLAGAAAAHDHDPSDRVEASAPLAELERQRPPRDFYARRRYWNERVARAAESGDPIALFDTLEARYRDLGHDPDLAFVQLALDRNERLRLARRALDDSQAWFDTAPPYRLDGAHPWPGSLADFLTVRARLEVQSGESDAAIRTLERAVAVDRPTPDRLASLGVLYADDGRHALAAPLLARALATDAGDLTPEQAERCRTALEEAIQAVGWWAPVSVDRWIALHEDGRPEPRTTTAPELEARFRALQVRFDDETPRPLLSAPGPVVVELWATWCGPCKQLLPHVDRLARVHEGDVTFIALSVDASEARARTWIATQGDVAYVPAWTDAGLEDLGSALLPTVLVFDEQHRLVDHFSGWSPGTHRLEEAVDALRKP